jgi:phenylacetate-CoA ligase
MSPYVSSPLVGRFARLSRGELEALQWSRLRRQLSRLHTHSPYYRDRMNAVGAQLDKMTSLETFRTLFPISCKADFIADQAAHPPFGQRLSIPRGCVALVNMTGGTSGQGQEIYGRSNHDIHIQGYLHALPWFLAGLRPGDIALNCVPAGGLTTGGWGPSEGLRIAGATAFHAGGSLSTDAKIDLMMRIGGMSFVYASTNYLHTLTETLSKRGLDPKDVFPDMRTLFIAAEAYPIEWAQKIEKIWGCKLQEGYGSTQCAGFAGSTCDEGVVTAEGQRGLLHLFEWESMIEVIDSETMEPVKSGETGELVVTNLSIEGSPVIRFRTGDAARFISHEDNGRDRAWNALECGTIKRLDDMMKIRGNNIWPSAIDAAVFAYDEVAEYTGRVYTGSGGKTEIEVRLAFIEDASPRSAEERANMISTVRAAIKERSNVWVDLVEVPRDKLPVFSYKAKRWKDERQDGYKL